ncbi:hypothetical protein GCM10011511_32490 [Puia dinghuensis]|uniref:BZIP transcription factor n=2 Tax=Puia dinghuensis TaxID=1792502 RepID=A0A8J2UF12_9BACT|nr:hypothetical protein GCM10011511_32490 [Puia dinghuensis]
MSQWSTPDASGNIWNTNTGKIGIGTGFGTTTPPLTKLDFNYAGAGQDIIAQFRSPNSGGVNILELKENNNVGLWRMYGVGGKGLWFYGNFNGTDPGAINLSANNSAINNTGTYSCVSINGFSIGNASSTGNFTFNNLSITPSINNTTGTTLVRGLYYNPTLTATAGTLTNVAYENVSGNNLLNSTSGNTIVGGGTDNGNKFQVNGKISATGLVLPTGAAAGMVLTSDANGNATWQAASGAFSPTSLFLANGNTTGATQTPLSLGNWNGSLTTVPSFQFNTSDNGTSNLDLHSTRWGTQVTFTRSDPTNNSYNVMQVGGNNSVGAIASLYNTSNVVTLQLNAQGTTYFTGGNVLIGKTSQTNSGYILDVNGNGRFNQVVVNTGGADFVFDPAYHLSSLPELQKYVQANHHLPDIAPAAEMQQKGVDLGDNQTRLLQKVEELTLYLIQQDKELKALKEQNQRLEERNQALESLEQRISRLEKSLK